MSSLFIHFGGALRMYIHEPPSPAGILETLKRE
jgi:hypothetical protein